MLNALEIKNRAFGQNAERKPHPLYLCWAFKINAIILGGGKRLIIKNFTAGAPTASGGNISQFICLKV